MSIYRPAKWAKEAGYSENTTSTPDHAVWTTIVSIESDAYLGEVK